MKNKKIIGFMLVIISAVALLFGASALSKKDVSLKAAEDDSPAYLPTYSTFSANQTTPAPDVPAEIPDLLSAVRFTKTLSLAVGGAALDDQGGVWLWGYNAYGKQGIGINYNESGTDRYQGGMKRVPYFAENNIKIIDIAGAYHTIYAQTDGGDLYAWGNGANGRMGNGTTTLHNNLPTKVNFPDNEKIVEMYCGTEVDHTIFARCENGNIYGWGYAGDQFANPFTNPRPSTIVPTLLTELTNLHKSKEIVSISLGHRHGVAITKDGKVYSWGYDGEGQLGLGSGYQSTNSVTEIPFFTNNNIKGKQASCNSEQSLVLTEDGKVYQFGFLRHLNYTGSAFHTPTLVEINTASAEYVPNFVQVQSGRYAQFALDHHGRVWTWGANTNYQFATDGPLVGGALNIEYDPTNPANGKHSKRLSKATQVLKILGDGDTENNGSAGMPAKAPVFSGFDSSGLKYFGETINHYREQGMWSSIDPGSWILHPSIYDKKYYETSSEPLGTNTALPGTSAMRALHDKVYLIDKDENRLVYVVRREKNTTPITYSGNFYIAEENYNGSWMVDNRNTTELPAGVTTKTSVPQVKEDERAWIEQSTGGQPNDFTGNQHGAVPYIVDISSYQSNLTLTDSAGNVYKQAFDGSGGVAWGWDYIPAYDYAAGSNNYGDGQGIIARSKKDGLFDMYCYELMFMRGAPRINPTTVKVKSPIKKIYKSDNSPTPEEAQEQHTNVEVTLGTATESTQLNIKIEPELTVARYVIIPYDNSDSGMLKTTGEVTKEDFEAAYSTAEAGNKGDLIELNQAEGGWPVLKNSDPENRLPLMDNDHIVVNDNCVLWVYTETKGYSSIPLELVSVQRYDNYYSDTTLYHNGKHVDEPKEEIYSKTSDYVKKMNDDGIPDKYGIPLDKNGVVIDHVTPTFDYDEVKINSYDQIEADVKAVNPAEKCDEYWDLIHYWYEIIPPLYEECTLNDLKYEDSKKYTHTFEYNRKASGWVTITYKGRYIGDTTDADNFEKYNMKEEGSNNNGLTFLADDPANTNATYLFTEIMKKSVGATDTITRTPAKNLGAKSDDVEIEGEAIHFTWSEDSHATEKGLTSGNMIVLPISVSDTDPDSTMEVIVYYEIKADAELYIRQLIRNANNEIVVPSQGYLGLLNTDGTLIGNNYNMMVLSGKESDEATIEYKRLQLIPATDMNKFQINPVLPQMYRYAGYRISIEKADNPTAALNTSKAEADYTNESSYYLTIYLEPTITTSDEVPFYNWDYKLNEFGKILGKP